MNQYLNEWLNAWRRAAAFKGRTNLREFWTVAIICYVQATIIGYIIALLPLNMPMVIESGVSALAMLPLVAAGFRRYQDRGRPGWQFLMVCGIQFLAFVLILVSGLFFRHVTVEPWDDVVPGIGMLVILVASVFHLVQFIGPSKLEFDSTHFQSAAPPPVFVPPVVAPRA